MKSFSVGRRFPISSILPSIKSLKVYFFPEIYLPSWSINKILKLIALFANSSIVEKKKSGYLSYRSKVWQSPSRGALPNFRPV